MLETGCKYYKDEAMFHGFIPHIMGTRFDILLIHSDAERLNRLWFHIINELERLDKILNRFDPQSEVSGINKHALLSYIQISKELEEILQLCQYYYENTFHLSGCMTSLLLPCSYKLKDVPNILQLCFISFCGER